MSVVIEILQGNKRSEYYYSTSDAAHQAVTDYMTKVGLGDYARSIINSLDKNCNVTLPALDTYQELTTCTFSMKTLDWDKPIG